MAFQIKGKRRVEHINDKPKPKSSNVRTPHTFSHRTGQSHTFDIIRESE